MAQLGIGMINMYVQMIKDQFKPIFDKLDAHDHVLKEHVEVEARKELGIYEMTVKKAQLKLELDELEKKLKKFEGKYGQYNSPLQILIRAKLEERRNGVHREIRDAMMQMIDSVKLCGVNSEIRETFEQLPLVVSDLQDKIKKLPELKPVKELT